MSAVDKLKFHLWFKLEAMETLLKRWEPIECVTEKSYEKSLIAFLRDELPGIEITPQYAKGRNKIDFMVGGRVGVEVKTNLKSLSAYQRLIGQIDEYKRWDTYTVIVLTGQTCPDLKLKLERHINEINDADFMNFAVKMRVISK